MLLGGWRVEVFCLDVFLLVSPQGGSGGFRCGGPHCIDPCMGGGVV